MNAAVGIVVGILILVLLGTVLARKLVERSVRREILRAVRRTPGVKASDIAKIVGLRELEVRVLLRILEDEGLLVTMPLSGDRRCFPIP